LFFGFTSVDPFYTDISIGKPLPLEVSLNTLKFLF